MGSAPKSVLPLPPQRKGLEHVAGRYQAHIQKLVPMWSALDLVVDAMHLEWDSRLRTWQEPVQAIKRVHGFGEFLAKEIVQDLLMTPILPNCSDLDTWTAIGTGGARGCNRLAGRQVHDNVSTEQMLLEFRQIFEHRDQLWPATLLGTPVQFPFSLLG